MAVYLMNMEHIGEDKDSLFRSHMEFGIDTISDIALLPTLNTNYKGLGLPAPWSLAYCAEDQIKRYLSPGGEWKDA